MALKTTLASVALALLACGSSGGATGPTTPSGGTTPSGAATPWVTAYYAGYYWDANGPDPAAAVAAVDMTALTHFVFARYAPGGGTLGGAPGQLLPGAGTGHARVEDALVAKAHAAGARALTVLGGAGDGRGFAASTAPAVRARFVAAVLDKAVEKNYDGVDVDWEDALDTPADQEQLTAFLRELRSAAAARPRYAPPNAPFLITLPTGFLNTNIDLPVPAWKVTVASLVDQFNLMTYAMYWDCCGWQSWLWAALKDAGPTHPTSVESSVKAFVDAGVPRAKIGMGLGLYGGGYGPPVTGPRQDLASAWGGDDNSSSWDDLYAAGMFEGATYHFDAAAQAGYYTYSPPRVFRGNTVSMLITEDADSIAAKGAWARAGGCGGTIVWTINYGYIPSLGTNPPMNAVKRAFLAR